MNCCLQGIGKAAAIGFLFASIGFAQSTFGSITGNVSDPSGAAIPAAKVVVTNQDTGTTRAVENTPSGFFTVSNLDTGTYMVTVMAKGFASYKREGLVLMANQIITVDAKLTIGTSSQSVDVTAPSPIITTEANDISSIMPAESVEQLPLVGRHAGDYGIYTYTTLATGTSSSASSPYPQFQGTRDTIGVMATMDGISVAAYAQGAAPVSIGMEDVQEIKVETSVAPAEFPTAGNVQVVSKSGTNDFHAAAFEDYNGNALNARNFFSTTVPWRVYNNFGVSASGPVVRNKLFFLADYEGSREAASGTSVETVPLPAWRSGNFSSLQTVRDPTTGQAFPGNAIPSNRISPVSQAVQNYIFPLPNTGAPGTLNNNWTKNVPSQTGFTDYNRADGRGDYNITDRDTVFARLSWMRMPYYSAGVYPLARIQTRYAQDAVSSYTHIFSPNIVNEFRTGATYHRNYFVANVVGSNLISQFGINGVPTVGVKTAPYFNITGVTTFNPSAGADYYNDNPDTSFEWIDNLSWTTGRHSMKYGFDSIRERYNGNSINYTVYGAYNFSGAYSGNAYADFLLGIPQTTSLAIPSPNRALRGTTFGLYAQDQFRVTSRLTVNYGIRWELPAPYHDVNGQVYNYDPATGGLVVPDNGLRLVNAFYPKNIPIITASQAHYPAGSLVNMDLKNVEPRIGFAYRLFGKDKTVLRGGYGIYTNLLYSPLAASMVGGPFAGSVTYYNSITNGVPLFSFPSPFLATGTTAVQNVSGVNPNLKTPYTQQWNFTLEQQIGSIGLRASYVGSRSINLIYQRNLNEPAPSTMPFSTALYPNQLFGGINYYDNGATDFYSALELSAQKRLGRDLTFNSGFTWAKDLTDAQDANGGGTTFASQLIQNQFCLACEKSNNALVPARRFFTYALYSLPVGAGQQFLSNAHGIVQTLFGGWQTSWTGEVQSGQYFTPSFSTFDPSNTGVIGGVPDRIVGAALYPANQTVSDWFNGSAFAIPGCPVTTPLCRNPANAGRFGTSGWNYLVGPALKNLDFGLSKDFKPIERLTVRFTMTMVDALNHPNFTNPNANISTPTSVGVISGTKGALLGEPSARNIDFVLRLMF